MCDPLFDNDEKITLEEDIVSTGLVLDLLDNDSDDVSEEE